MKKITISKMQQKIDGLQRVYEEWLALVPKLETAQEDWFKAQTLIQELREFYLASPGADTWMEYQRAIEEGQTIDMTTASGSYHIMSQDTIWDAIAKQDELAWQWLRLALKTLDPKYQT
ncbi:MAG: DUF4298 domain-containing protein [Neisseriaceae bacterium]